MSISRFDSDYDIGVALDPSVAADRFLELNLTQACPDTVDSEDLCGTWAMQCQYCSPPTYVQMPADLAGTLILHILERLDAPHEAGPAPLNPCFYVFIIIVKLWMEGLEIHVRWAVSASMQ